MAYHDIGDASAFGRQLDFLLDSGFQTVTGSQVADALMGLTELPPKPVWITFDDGLPEVFTSGLSLLSERKMKATAFVCPAVLGTCTPYWWTVVDEAVSFGLVVEGDLGVMDAAAITRRLKQMSDTQRRAIVEIFAQRLATVGDRVEKPQLTLTALRAWCSDGHEVGNHSWDHPCLDRCDPEEQERQVSEAHEALNHILGAPPQVFAWPNGNEAPAALSRLTLLGYRLVVRFDHRLCTASPDMLAISRLRVDSSAEIGRFRSIVSGVHPALFQLNRRVRAWLRG